MRERERRWRVLPCIAKLLLVGLWGEMEVETTLRHTLVSQSFDNLKMGTVDEGGRWTCVSGVWH